MSERGITDDSKYLPRKVGLDLSKTGLQKVGTTGTGGTGKQSDLRGKSVYFLHILIYF